MAEIKQSLGFNAAQAIDTLNRLDTIMRSFKSGVSSTTKALGSFNAKADKTDGVLKRLKTSAGGAATQMANLNKQSGATKLDATNVAATQAASAMDKVGAAANTAGKKGAKAVDDAAEKTKKWTISWETLGRVVATQAIVRVLSLIRNTLNGAVTDAVSFQRAVAEIGTIGRGLGGLDAIADSVTRVSAAFNIGLSDTAEAAYQTISNQIASTQKDVESFLGSAAKFSKITKTDMTTAVNLLSGTLNAFGKDVSEAESVAAKFFKTIELGRTRAEELAQGLGTVAPIADKLGVSLEEINAILATLTISGVKTDKAFTQIRGTMQAFLKPTTAMKEALKELGFASGEQLLQANNLQEALRLVATQTDLSAQSIAKLFPRIRGMTGVLTALDDSTGHFNRTLKDQRKELQEVYDQAYQLVIETDAEKVTKELNKLKNFFTVEFGQSVLESSVALFDTVGGADKLTSIFKALAPVLPQIALGLGGIGAALVVLKVNALLTAGALSGLLPIVAAFAAAAVAGQVIGNFAATEIAAGWDDEFKVAVKVLGEELEARKKKTLAEVALEKAKVAELSQILAKGLAVDQKEHFDFVDSTILGNEEILENVKLTTAKIVAVRQKMVSKLQNQVASMGKNILSSEERVTDARTTLEDRLFKRKIKDDSARIKVNKLVQKSSEIASEAADKLARATTEDERSSAAEEFQRAQAFADQAIQIADTADSRSLESKAVQNLKDLTEELTHAEGQYQKNVAASVKAVASRTLKEEKRLGKLKKKQTELLDALKITDEDGGLLSKEDRSKQLIKAQKALREFVDLSGDPLDVATMLNYTGVSAQLQSQLGDFRIQQLSFSTEALRMANKQLNDAVSLRKVRVPEAGALEALTGIEVIDAQSQTEALTVMEDKFGNLLTLNKKYKDQINAVKIAQIQVNKALEKGAKESSGLVTGITSVIAKVDQKLGVDSVVGYTDALQEAQTMASRAAQGIIPSMSQLQVVNNNLKKSAEELSIEYRVGFGALTTAAANAMNSVKLLLDEQQKLRDIKVEAGISPESVQQQLSVLQTVNQMFKAPEEAAKAVATHTGTTKTNVSDTVNPAQKVAEWQSQQAAAAERAATANAASLNSLSGITSLSGLGRKRIGELASGGRVGYFANGGRGTDTIPAMLSAGEHVTNARSSRRFFSQLQAMNAGQQPVFRNDGGDTYNTEVGDINVSGAGKPAVVAREVMKAIRREERRGSGR